MYTHDDPPGEYCVFQKCKDYYYDNGSKTCAKGTCIEGTTETCPHDCKVHTCRSGQWSNCYCNDIDCPGCEP